MADLSMTPDLRELLGAIADDPRAQLLRVKSHQAFREGLEQSPKVSSSAPFLQKSERRLLELHREELGRLLYAYAHVVRMQVPGNALRVHYQDCKVAPPTKAETDHRARVLLRTKAAEESGADLLQRCLESTTGVRPTEVIGAVLRIAPSDRAMVALGADLGLEGSMAEASAALRSFMARRAGSPIDSYASENLGFVASTLSKYGEAASCYEAAVRSDPSRVAPALYWLRFSLLAMSEHSARRAAAFVDSRVESTAPALAWFRWLGEAGAGPRSSDDQRKLARIIKDQAGPVSRRVIDAFK